MGIAATKKMEEYLRYYSLLTIHYYMTRTQIYIPEDLLLEAKLVAKNNGITLSELIREAIKKFTTKPKKKKTKLTKIKPIVYNDSLFGGLESNQISKKIDDMVYE